MQIRTYQNVMRLDHVTGTGEHALRMAEVATEFVNDSLLRYPHVAMINDGEHFKSPSEEFLRTWAAWVQANRDKKVVIVACTPSAWVRATAKTVSVLARVDFEILKSYQEAVDHLRQQGFPDVTNVPWNSVLLLEADVKAAG